MIRKACIVLAAFAAGAALFIGGCGGGGSPDSTPAASTPTTPLAWDSVSATWDQVTWQ